MLPGIIAGSVKSCFAVTEPNAGLNTTALQTRAERQGNHYVVSGHKVWTSTAQVADKMLLIARTTPRDQCKRATDGLSLFFTDFDRAHIDVREIEKMGRKAIDSNEIFIDGLRVREDDRIGDEGSGFRYLLHGLNPERILIAAEAVGVGKLALARAAKYAKDRVVFDRPIGQNQAIQHPLAQSWIDLEAAELMLFKAARLYDAGEDAGQEANAAKYLGGRAGYDACLRAVMTHGGYGYAKEFHVERYLREIIIPRLAPVSEQLILCYIAERSLGLPKSY
jgi:acyl-CoA dehydrogenase